MGVLLGGKKTQKGEPHPETLSVPTRSGQSKAELSAVRQGGGGVQSGQGGFFLKTGLG